MLVWLVSLYLHSFMAPPSTHFIAFVSLCPLSEPIAGSHTDAMRSLPRAIAPTPFPTSYRASPISQLDLDFGPLSEAMQST